MRDDIKMVDATSLRDLAAATSKKFKHSWIELGRILYTIWKDKVYKNWGYQQFDTYVTKEIGIRKNTSLKLLRSYYFLEQEEPHYLQKEYTDTAQAVQIPSYESIDILRQAKAKNIDEQEYQQLKEGIFFKGKDSRESKKDLTQLIRQRQELDPQEAWEKKRQSHIKRFMTTLKSLKREMEETQSLPVSLAGQIDSLIGQLEQELL